MTDGLTITIDDAAVQAAFVRLQRIGQDASPMMAEIAEHLLESTQRRFDTGIGPDGQPWAKLRDGSGRTPLRVSGTLRDQIFPSHGPDFAEIAATTTYARWHQEGVDHPWVILPRSGQALAFPGKDGKKIARRKVTHPGLPARPFIGLSDQDRADIGQIASAYLEDAAEGSS